MKNNQKALILVLVCVVLVTAGQISMKSGMNSFENISTSDFIKNIIQIVFTPLVILGILFYAIGAVLWLTAMSTLDISYMLPLISLGYVLTAIIALIFLAEKISFIGWLGIVIITFGSFLVTKS